MITLQEVTPTSNVWKGYENKPSLTPLEDNTLLRETLYHHLGQRQLKNHTNAKVGRISSPTSFLLWKNICRIFFHLNRDN